MGNYKRIISFGAHPLDAELQGGPMIIRYSERTYNNIPYR